MKRVFVVIAALAILFAGACFGSAYLAARHFKQAALSADADKLDAAVDFPAVRDSLKSQVSALMMRKLQTDQEMKGNPFAGLGMMLAPVIIDKAVDAYVTPDGISAMVKGQKPGEGAPKDINPDVKADYDWLSVDAGDAQLLAPGSDLVFLQERIQPLLERPDARQRLHGTSIGKVCLRCADRLAHHLARQIQLSRYRLDGFSGRMLAPDLQHRLQYQHPDLAARLPPSARA